MTLYIFIVYSTVLLYIAYLIIIRNITNKKYDRYYNINTRGLRDWDKNGLYNRTESTPYQALINLVEEYQVDEDSQLVDFGSGKGRTMIYLHHKLDIPVTGVEINEATYKEAEDNIQRYLDTVGDNTKSINVVKEYAESYVIQKADNIFFFFNPFSPKIFKKVLGNIVKNADKYNKSIDVVLYYPIKDCEVDLKRAGFQLTQRIKAKRSIGFNEKFIIYRYKPKGN